jgi:ppGpp synthetase/RelA/SpoT-type nucleotidyltranferase
MALSGKQVQKLRQRLKEADLSIEDLALLDEFRRDFDERLLAVSASVSAAVHAVGRQYLLAGRAKRTKSIIRKLRREASRNMDLSRMDDIVGLRVIVPDPESQQIAIDAVRGSIKEVREPFDYRDLPAGRYRAVHLVLGEPSRRVEVQIRTVAQHLWADACERFGERAKEGQPTDEEQTYLNELGVFCIQTDAGDVEASDPGFLSRYRILHAGLTAPHAPPEQMHSYVVTYNILTDQLVRCERFPSTANGRFEALDFYRYQVRSLSDNEFDVLVLNSSSEGALKVTHPRYFPEQ